MNKRGQKEILIGTSKVLSVSTSNCCPHCGKLLNELIIPNWYTIQLYRDSPRGGRWVARCTNLQGAISDGATEDEALDNIREAIQAIEEARSGGP